jgi:hypothetical protein
MSCYTCARSDVERLNKEGWIYGEPHEKFMDLEVESNNQTKEYEHVVNRLKGL